MTNNDCGYYKAKCSSLEEGYLKLQRENEQLKYQTAMLKEELEQCKAVIDNKWSEYLQRKELIE